MKIKWENIVNIGNECHFIQEIEYGDFNYVIGKKSTTCPLRVGIVVGKVVIFNATLFVDWTYGHWSQRVALSSGVCH